MALDWRPDSSDLLGAGGGAEGGVGDEGAVALDLARAAAVGLALLPGEGGLSPLESLDSAGTWEVPRPRGRGLQVAQRWAHMQPGRHVWPRALVLAPEAPGQGLSPVA